jgi:ParB family chromosome partitioning protein
MSNDKKRALGRGLSALLESESISVSSPQTHAATGGTSLIPLEFVEANPFQPRSHFDQQQLDDLAASIRQHGVIQPITVRRISKDKYQLISGERRWKASQMAGLTEVPAYVRVANDQAMLEMALIENTHREDLDPIEVSIGYQRLIEECGLTQEDLSDKVGRDRSTVSNFLRLLKLPPVIQLAIREKKISMGHAKALINIDNPATQLSVFDKILDESLSVRATEDKARDAKSSLVKPKRSSNGQNSSDDNRLEKELSHRFSSKVKVTRGSSGKGKLVISFSSDEGLKKIVELLHA